jgi:hypothetical protein
MSLSLVDALIQGWKSCENTALREDVECDCNFKWNSFQKAYACMIGTGHTTPAERAGMYHRYKRECGCVKVSSNGDGIDLGKIAEGVGASDAAVSEELARLRQFLLLEQIHQVVLNPSCEGAKKLFARWDVSGNGEIDSDSVIATFANFQSYQAEQLSKQELENVQDITEEIFAALDRWSKGPKIPISESNLVSMILGSGAVC